MKSKLTGKQILPAVLAVSLASAVSANAAVVTATSNAYGVNTSVSALSLVTLAVNTPTVSGIAPAPYSPSNNTASVNTSIPLLGSVVTGVVTATATSTVDGTAGIKTSTAQAVVNGLNLGLLGSILSIGATTITSTSSVVGENSLVPTSTSVITNLAVTALGTTLTIPAAAYTTPNYVLFNTGGLTIILNESISSTVGNTTSVTTNAIRVSLANVGNLPVVNQAVNGQITIGHSFASATIPEPGVLALSLGGTFFLLLRKRRC